MFVLSNIRSSDDDGLARAQAFLAANPADGVRSRPPDESERAGDTGQCLIVSEEGQTCGCSLIYKFDTWPSGPVFSEIGTMRISRQGFGLQLFIAKFHLFQIYLEDYGDDLPEVFAVVAPATASEHILEDRAGLRPAQPPGSLQAKRADRGVAFAPDKKVLFADDQAFGSAFRSLSSWHVRDRIFRTPKGDERIKVNIEWFFPELLGLYG